MWRRAFGAVIALALVLLMRGEVLAVLLPSPQGVAVNSMTNRIYVTSSDQGLWVINGMTGRIITNIPLGFTSVGVDVNEATNRVYVALTDSIAVIDGNTNGEIARIPFPDNFLSGVAANSATNRIYAAHGQYYVSAIDGETNQVIARVRVGLRPRAVAVDSTLNLIFVAVGGRDRVSVIDGTSNAEVAEIQVGKTPIGVGVNPRTSRTYVANFTSNTVSVIQDRALVATIPVRKAPWGVDVNPTSNRIYVGSEGNWVSVIDGVSNQVAEVVTVGDRPNWLGANRATNRIYVGNGRSNNVSILYEDERLVNASFDTDRNEDRLPDHWRGTGLGFDDQLDNVEPPYDGRYSFRFIGETGLNKQLRQAFDIAGSASSTLKLEGTSKADGASPGGGAYEIEANVVFSDGTSDTFAVRFKKGTHDWQREVARFSALKSFGRVTIRVRYDNQSGRAWFDALHLQIKR